MASRQLALLTSQQRGRHSAWWKWRPPRHDGFHSSGDRLAAAGRSRTAVALELTPGLMWASGRLGRRDLGDGHGPHQRLDVHLEELATCFRQERPTCMPDTRIGTRAQRAGSPDWTAGTPAQTLFLPPQPLRTCKEGPGPSALRLVSPTCPVASPTAACLPSSAGEAPDTPRADPPGHTRAARRREDQYRIAAPPHSLPVRTSRAEG